MIAVRTVPVQTLALLFPFLLPSSPFVIFCEYMEVITEFPPTRIFSPCTHFPHLPIQPLVRCYHALSAYNAAIFMNITETWMRPYQVLLDHFHKQRILCDSSSSEFLLLSI